MTLPSYPLAVGVLIVLMVAAVVASGVLENHDPKRRGHRSSPRAGLPGDVTPTTPTPIAAPPIAAPPIAPMPIDAAAVASARAPDESVGSVALRGTRSEPAVASDPFDEHRGEASAAHAPGPSQAMVVLVPTSHARGQDPDVVTGAIEATSDSRSDGAVFELGPLGVDSELAGVLFAAYVASGSIRVVAGDRMGDSSGGTAFARNRSR